jgi:hypothetical protein
VVLHARPRGEAGCRGKCARAGEVSERNHKSSLASGACGMLVRN